MAEKPDISLDIDRQPILRSMSARLLVLTLIFVMVGEILIYAPSVARFRKDYLAERIAAAHLATLALEDTGARNVSPAMRQRLLQHSETYNIVLKLPTRRLFILGTEKLPVIDKTFDLREPVFFGWIVDAFEVLLQTEKRILRIVGPSPKDAAVQIEIFIDEQPMRRAMIDFSWRILGLSIFISLIAGSLVYLSLQWLMVRPMRRITKSMETFRANPENERADIQRSNRGDEIGIAERELRVMQREVRLAMRQSRRLAALGASIAKVNHDLRNSLTTAMLVSDRLTGSEDPEVKRLLPKLFNAIDKAVNLCSQTLNFARQGSPLLAPSCFSLRDLIDEVDSAVQASDLGDHGTHWINSVDREVLVEADREQLFRVINNLGRNAVQAGAKLITVAVSPKLGNAVCIKVEDDGPGLAEIARDNLFTPFAGTTKKDGTGLGLVIARDVMRAHGGDLNILRSDENGTIFGIELPENIKEGASLWY
jgi:signal transduction histidine kinase